MIRAKSSTRDVHCKSRFQLQEASGRPELAAFDTTVLAALAVGGVSGSKKSLAPPLGVGGSGVRNGVGLEPDEASARAELVAAVSCCPVADVSASALRFRSAVGATVGSAF